MKFPYPTLSRLMSGRSAIIEPGDGEMTVPPVLQPTLDIFSPLLVPAGATAGPMDDTWMNAINTIISGVNAADFNQSFVTFAAGRWDIFINFHFTFTGTSNQNNDSGLDLVDDLGNVCAIINFPHFGSAIRSSDRSITLPFLFTRPGWFLRTRAGIMIALDTLNITCTVYARRIF